MTPFEKNQLYFYIYSVLKDFPDDPKMAAQEICLHVAEIVEKRNFSVEAEPGSAPVKNMGEMFRRVET